MLIKKFNEITNNKFHADGFDDLKQILKRDLESSKDVLKTDKKNVKELVKAYKNKIKNLRKSVF